MTKREKKYQRRLFAELHLQKAEQLLLIRMSPPSWYAFYQEYKHSEITGWSTTWMVSLAFRRLIRVMREAGTSVQELGDRLSSILKKGEESDE